MPPDVEAQRLIDDLHATRAALLELARAVPESRIYRATARPGWTLKHELASLAAGDAEVLHVLGEVRRRPALPADGLDLRRRYGEALHAMRELRLGTLLERLEQDGARLVEALGEHADALTLPLRVVGSEVASMTDLVRAHRDRGRAAVATFSEAQG